MDEILHRLTTKNSVAEVYGDRLEFRWHKRYYKGLRHPVRSAMTLPMSMVRGVWVEPATLLRSARVHLPHLLWEDFHLELLRGKAQQRLGEDLAETVRKRMAGPAASGFNGFRLELRPIYPFPLDVDPHEEPGRMVLEEREDKRRLVLRLPEGEEIVELDSSPQGQALFSMLDRGLTLWVVMGQHPVNGARRVRSYILSEQQNNICDTSARSTEKAA